MKTLTKEPEAYSAIFAAVDNTVKDYREDLTKHDRAAIEEAGSRTPFIHYAGKHGTFIMFLIGAEDYPKAGEYVPYLFGTADRLHLLKEFNSMAAYHVRNADQRPVCHFWTGSKLKKITHAEAVHIASDYTEKIRNTWK